MIHVFGLGECGSRIALDLFAQLYPNATIDDSPPPTVLRRSLATLTSLLSKASAGTDATIGFRLGPIDISLKPHIFIGDLNKGNTNYRRYLAAQRIRELGGTDREKCKTVLRDEGLLDERIQFDRLFDLVAKQGSEEFITLLRFARENGNRLPDASFDLSAGMAGEGAGGNQIYSELAAEKYQVHHRLEEMQGSKTILVGVFSVGGGTGAGSANQIFRALASTGYSYTLGVAVMPTWDDVEQRARAGRYLAKYLKVDAANRSRGLLLLSNQAAGVAIRGLERRDGVEQASSLAAVNEYALNCLKAILLLRATTLKTIEGKQLDYMDMSTWMSGMFIMGYACQRAGVTAEVDLWPHVIRAVAPMSLAQDQQQNEGPGGTGVFLEGLSVSATERSDPIEAEAESKTLRGKLLTAADALASAKTAAERDSAKEKLREVGNEFPLYGTIKRCTFLIFVPSTAKITNLPAVKDRLRAFFSGMTGNQSFDLSFNVYSIEGLAQIEVVAFPRECLTREVVMHVLDFTSKAFVSEADPNHIAAAQQLVRETWDQLGKVFRMESSGFGTDAQRCSQEIKKFLDGLAQYEHMFEIREDLYGRVQATRAEAEKMRFQAGDLISVIDQFRLLARTLPLVDTSPPPMRRGPNPNVEIPQPRASNTQAPSQPSAELKPKSN